MLLQYQWLICLTDAIGVRAQPFLLLIIPLQGIAQAISHRREQYDTKNNIKITIKQ
jgi:hypothetical protein